MTQVLCWSKIATMTNTIAMMIAMTLKDTPPKLDGTTIVRIVLSALAEMSMVPDGLNLSAVGGNECTCRIFRRGWGQLTDAHL